VTARKVEAEGRCVRNVEAGDRARYGEAGDYVAGFASEAAKALALGAKNQGDTITGDGAFDRTVGVAVEADAGKAHGANFLQCPSEILDLDPLDPVEGAGGRLGENAGFGGGVATGGDDRVGGEGDRGAEDRADVVRVGDLVKDDDQFRLGDGVEAERGEGRDFDGNSLVDGVDAEQAVEIAGRRLLRWRRRRDPGLGQAGERVRRGEDTQDLAARIGQGRFDRVDPVDPERIRPPLGRRALGEAALLLDAGALTLVSFGRCVAAAHGRTFFGAPLSTATSFFGATAR
jgi:hypothetical protein